MFYSLWCGGTKHNYPLTCFARQAGRQVLHSKAPVACSSNSVSNEGEKAESRQGEVHFTHSPSSSNPRLHDWPLPAQGPAPMSEWISQHQQQATAATAGSSMPAASGAGASEY